MIKLLHFFTAKKNPGKLKMTNRLGGIEFVKEIFFVFLEQLSVSRAPQRLFVTTVKDLESGGNSTFINSFDKTKFFFQSPTDTQYPSFFRD